MALFQSGNPTLTQKFFDKSQALAGDVSGTMTVRGTLNKFGFLMLMVVCGAGYSWHLFEQQQLSLMQTLMWVGVFGGFGAALAMTFKPNWAPYIAPAYGILEGLFLGALSAVMNAAFAKSYPNLIMNAVGLTLGVAIAMFLLYNFRIINATEKFKSVLITATLGIGIFYLIVMVLRMFHVNIPFMNFGDNSTLGIGISLFIVAIAALNLILDFDRIEQGAISGAPKFMEWYSAFGLLVTIVWLYIEILRLLSRFAGKD